MSFCANCGNELPGGAAFCPSCGGQIQRPANVVPQPQVYQGANIPPAHIARPAPRSAAASSTKRDVALGIAGAVLLLLLFWPLTLTTWYAWVWVLGAVVGALGGWLMSMRRVQPAAIYFSLALLVLIHVLWRILEFDYRIMHYTFMAASGLLPALAIGSVVRGAISSGSGSGQGITGGALIALLAVVGGGLLLLITWLAGRGMWVSGSILIILGVGAMVIYAAMGQADRVSIPMAPAQGGQPYPGAQQTYPVAQQGYPVAQQAYQGARPAYPAAVPNHMVWAILSLLLFFWPTSIPALVYANRVNSLLAYGDIAGAMEASRKAKVWCWVSTGIAIGWVVIALIVVAAVGASL